MKAQLLKIVFEGGFEEIYEDCSIELNTAEDFLDVTEGNGNEHSYELNESIQSIEIIISTES